MADRISKPESPDVRTNRDVQRPSQTFRTDYGPQFVSTHKSTLCASYFAGSGPVYQYGGVAGDVVHKDCATVQALGYFVPLCSRPWLTNRTAPEIAPDEAPSRTFWAVNRFPTRNFTGRDDESHTIEDALNNVLKEPPEQASGSNCFVVWGMGGQGKSELCLHMAWKFRSRFWGVFWVDARTNAAAERDLSNIAVSLSLTSDRPAYVLTFLANSKQPWLLIFDNADDIDVDYQAFLPSNPHSVVLMTSRIGTLGERFGTIGHIELLSLAQKDAQDLLIKTACLSPEQAKLHAENVVAVANLLGHHTLAIIQAGTYIANGYCKIAEYPEHFERRRATVLSFELSSGSSSGSSTVHTALEASFARLEDNEGEKYRDALDLMELLSALPYHPVVIDQFEAAWKGARAIRQGKNDTMWNTEPDNDDVDALIPLIQPDSSEWNSFRLREACRVLTSVALVSISPEYGSDVISMHTITHAWAKTRLRYERPEEPWELAGSFLVLSLRDANSWPAIGWVDMSDFSMFNLVHLVSVFHEWPGVLSGETDPQSDKLSRILNVLRLAFFEHIPTEAFRGTIEFSEGEVHIQSLWMHSRWQIALNRLTRECNPETSAAAKWMEDAVKFLRSLNTHDAMLRRMPSPLQEEHFDQNRLAALTSLLQRLQLCRSILMIDLSVEQAACLLRNKRPAVAIDCLMEAKSVLEHLGGSNTNRRWLHFCYVMSAACVMAEKWNEAVDHLERVQSMIYNSPNSRFLAVKYSLRPVLILKTCCNLQDPERAIRLIRRLQEEQTDSASQSFPKVIAKGHALTAAMLALRLRDLDDVNASKMAMEKMLTDAEYKGSSDTRQLFLESMTNNECWNKDANPHAFDIMREIIVLGGADESTRECQTLEEFRTKLQQWTERRDDGNNNHGEAGVDDDQQPHDSPKTNSAEQREVKFRRDEWLAYLEPILDELIHRVHYPYLTT